MGGEDEGKNKVTAARSLTYTDHLLPQCPEHPIRATGATGMFSINSCAFIEFRRRELHVQYDDTGV